MADKTFVVRPEELPTFAPAAAHKGTINRRLIGPETVGAKNIEVILGEISPSGMGEPHYHDTQEQVIYLLEGEAKVEVDGETREMKPGDAAFFAPGKKHKLWPVGGPIKVLVIYAPPLGTSPNVFKT